MDNLSPFVCNTYFNLINIRDTRHIPLLPICHDIGQQIVDPELFQKVSAYNDRNIEIMLKETLGAVKFTKKKLLNNKDTGRINKNDKESEGGNDREDSPGKKRGGETIPI